MPSLLDALLASGTAVDLDCNDAAAGLVHIQAHPSQRLADMTSNQLIVKAELSRADTNEGEYSDQIKQLIKRAAKIANELAQQGGQAFEAAKDLEGAEELKKRAAAKVDEMEKDDQSWKQGMAIDAATALLGLLVRPHLDSVGRLHAQVSPTLTTTDAVVTHARRIVSLYILLSSTTDGVSRVSFNNVCIKIPSTVAGLKACSILEAEGIVTLATTCFTVEQALASSEAKAHYVAPYLNSLQAHFYTSESTPESEKIQADVQPSIDVIHAIQRVFRREKSKTQVMAASFVEYHEPLRLAGLDRVTIGAPILAVLRDTESDEAHQRLIDEAISAITIEHPETGATRVEELEGRALESEEKSRNQGKGWLDQGSQAHKALVEALEQERPRRMLQDALSRFTAAEVWLRQRMAKEL